MKLLLCLFLVFNLHGYVQHAHLESNWYPATKRELHNMCATLFDDAHHYYHADLDHALIRAIIVPHAGYTYSGTVAAAVYRLLDKKRITRIIILAPDHAAAYHGVALPLFDGYKTVLGTLAVDTSFVQELAEHRLFHQESEVFDREHSLEVQLPFIQYCLQDQVQLVPFIVGKVTCKQAKQIAQIIKKFLGPQTLLVVTTDFTHYGKQFNFAPFKDHIAYRIRDLDSHVVQLIESGNCRNFAQFIKKSQATICGHYPIEILLALLEMGAFGSVEPRLIAYDSSGRQENNFSNSVSYVGMLFTEQKLLELPISKQLTQQEQRALLQQAHDVLYNIFEKTVPEELLYPIQSFGVTQHHGAFTTLETVTKKGKQLRGCIGQVITNDPLYKTVAQVTRDTALHDTRFTPVTQQELPNLLLKLSILSPVQEISSYQDIVLGKHGIIMQVQDKSALFLPEVPIEFTWSLDKTLQELSEKAGLDKDAYKRHDAKFSVFETLDIES